MSGSVIVLNGSPVGENRLGTIKIEFASASRAVKATYTSPDGTTQDLPIQKDDCYIWPYIQANVNLKNGEVQKTVQSPIFLDASLKTARMNFQPHEEGYALIKQGTPDAAIEFTTDKAGYHEKATYMRDLNVDDVLDWVQYSSHVQEGHPLLGLATLTMTSK